MLHFNNVVTRLREIKQPAWITQLLNGRSKFGIKKYSPRNLSFSVSTSSPIFSMLDAIYFLFFVNVYLFIYLYQVLVVACELLVEACGI